MRFTRSLTAKLFRALPNSRAQGWARYIRDMQKLEEADVAFVSFPKSGRTFVRVMLARLYQRQFGIDERKVLQFSTLRDAAADVPRLLFTHDGDAMRRPDQIHLEPAPYSGRKVVLLARHPGDVVVSRYHHLKNRSTDPARRRLASQPLDHFVWTPKGGVPSIIRFLNQWAELARSRQDVLILRYEDFLDHPEESLGKLAAFVGLDDHPETVRDAVEFAKFENLRAKERAGYFESSRFGPGRAGNEESFKVRSGKSGGFRSKISPENARRVDLAVAEQLDPVFGY